MNKVLVFLVAAAASVAGLAARSTPASTAGGDPSLAQLAWLAGEWRGTVDGAEVVSWHSDPSGGMIVMASKEVRNGKASMFDFGIVSSRNDQVGYVPYPYGKPSVAFQMTESDAKARRVTFANEEHDFPQRFVFERGADDVLSITLSGGEGEQAQTVVYQLRLAGAKAAPAR